MRRVMGAFVIGGSVVALIAVTDYISHGFVSHALHTNVPIQGATDYRTGRVTAPFATPADLSLCMSLLFGIAIAAYSTRQQKRYLGAALLFMCAVALSLRLKGVLSVGAVLLVVLACRVYSRQARLAGLLAVTAILGLAVGFYEGEIVSRQVTTYTAGASAKNPRGLLYQVGTDIARDNFPLGAGFGRFGSFTSGVHYSPIYGQYGLAEVYGLSRDHTQYISDTSWASLLGETGVWGAALYALGLAILGVAGFSVYRRALGWHETVALALLTSLGVLLVDSVGDPSLFSWFAATTVAILVGCTFRPATAM